MIRIFIGYDPSESSAYHVLAHSIARRSSQPVSITPIRLNNLPMYYRPREVTHSTEFSLSRFIVPYLCNYKGWAIFMDCDMLMLDDITKLWDMRDVGYDVMVCKHEYEPKTDIKMLGTMQTKYQMKNWSSLMLFNNEECRNLTKEYVNTASGLELHQFHWADEIGSLPLQWNWLVGEYEPIPNPKCVHYTLGGPWWHQFSDVPYAHLWRDELASMLHESEDDKRHATTRLLQTAARGEIEAAAKRQAECA